MADIFLSYSSEDSARAKLIVEVLAARGWSVWWDHTIAPGEAWADVIEREIKDCGCVVVLWSKISSKSDWVPKEARFGAMRQVLIPVLIDETEPPFEFELIEAAQLGDWRGEPTHPELDHFVNAIANRVSLPERGPPPLSAEHTEATVGDGRVGQETTVTISARDGDGNRATGGWGRGCGDGWGCEQGMKFTRPWGFDRPITPVW